MEQMLLKAMRWKLCEFNVEISDEKRDGEGNREGQEGGGSDLSSSYSWESNILLLLAAPIAAMSVCGRFSIFDHRVIFLTVGV